jgi:hypothetical protein
MKKVILVIGLMIIGKAAFATDFLGSSSKEFSFHCSIPGIKTIIVSLKDVESEMSTTYHGILIDDGKYYEVHASFDYEKLRISSVDNKYLLIIDARIANRDEQDEFFKATYNEQDNYSCAQF